MKLKKISLILVSAGIALGSCKKELLVRNPNQPTPESASTELGIISLAQGTVYINGFKNAKYADGVYGAFWSGAMGFHEMMGDVALAEAANAFINQIGAPNKVVLDDNTVVLNPNAPNQQIAMIRQNNINSNQGENFLYYEWAFMYNMIHGCNVVLEVVDGVTFSSDGDTKKAAIVAWANWWKGYAYSHIGSMYYAGIINDASFGTNGDFVTKEAIISEATACFDRCATALGGVTNGVAYEEFMGKIIPDFFQVGKGGVMTPDMWLRSINTMKARNILVSKTVTEMTSADWSAILTLTNSGINASDNVFTGRSNVNGDFLTSSGTVAGKTQSTIAGSNTYKLSERWVQEFKPGDLRKDNNVSLTATWIGNSDRGNSFNTRYALISGGNGLPGVAVYANSDAGEYELYLAGNYEENQLMKAEALLYLAASQGDRDVALAIIDGIRDDQGAGLAAVSGTGLDLAASLEELRRERRIVLAFRGLSFYDARRWKVIDYIAQGGGRTGAVVIDNSGNLNTNATIEYGFLDFWDVPDNELVYNPPNAGSAPVVNPKN